VTSLGIEYAIYDPSTGDILEMRKTGRLATAEANCPIGKALYIGQANSKSNRIINGEKVERTDRSQDDLSEAVTQERDRRLALGFTWQSVTFQCDDTTQQRIASMGALAGRKRDTDLADSLRWLYPDRDFYWIASDNSHVPMTAMQMLDFAGTAALFASHHVTTAAAMKRLQPIPQDITSDNYWQGA